MSRNAPPTSAVPARTQIARERSERELRRARRRAGFAAGEVKELTCLTCHVLCLTWTVLAH